jgi:hypothetical protein
MIFQQIDALLSGKKTQTRRIAKPTEASISHFQAPDLIRQVYTYANGRRIKWNIGNDYAIVPKRGAKSIGRRVRITGIRREQLHAITEADAVSEGVGSVAQYRQLWESINGAGSWAKNPDVWVLTLELVQ